MLSPAGTLQAATFPEFFDPHPANGNQFGATVVALNTGNVVITSPFDDAGGTDAGAVYLFNGATGALISTLRGSTASDNIGSGGVTSLSNGNFVIRSLLWDNGALGNAGAVTWGSGTSGVSGTVSAANSLVGSKASDQVGSGGVIPLISGNYVVVSPNWDNGATTNVGAATWCSGSTGRIGALSIANSLIGGTASDQIGSGGVSSLVNGNYAVVSPKWNYSGIANSGAVTWGSGTAGVSGQVSDLNSLYSSSGLMFGDGGVIPLANGNYVVLSQTLAAATWANGTTASFGDIDFNPTSTLTSTSMSGVTPLSNGNYVVQSPNWNNVGAMTWCNGTTGSGGSVSAGNSLVGSTTSDMVNSSVVALSNGNYVVASPLWNNGGVADAGAATWCNGTTGLVGTVSTSNSLVGSTASDQVGSGGVAALSNGNYVVSSPLWNNGGIVDAGAATWRSGASGTNGVVSVANSLVGSTANDQVGSSGAAFLVNGHYVVRSPNWDNGAVVNAGAATWGDGTSGSSGAVAIANSLVGSTANDNVGGTVAALGDSNYVVLSPNWDNAGIVNAGAVTWRSGSIGVSDTVRVTNSLVGSTANDQVGSGGLISFFSTGNYVVRSPIWDNADPANGGGVIYTDAGAATWRGGASGVTGTVSGANSLVGTIGGANLISITVDNVNGTFLARFRDEGTGRVRVGPVPNYPPSIVSAVDLPNDEGGYVRLTFTRSALDGPGSTPPVSTYGIWRHLPGTLPAGAREANPGAATLSRPDAASTERLRSALPAGLGVREVEGRFYVTGPRSPAAGIAAAFPPGTWELIVNVPATQQAQYVVAAPTISNAAPNDFVVTAHTTTPSIWFISATASAQSVDNLPPAQPTSVTAAYSGGQTSLGWAANTENDLGGYRVYRGASADFTPAPGNRIATPVSTSYADVGAPGSYYKLSAVDVNGNESNFALLTPEMTLGVDDGVPVALALEGVRPNPASGRGLHVAFALPSGDAARLELLDVSGRREVWREVGSFGVGRHTVNLAEGRRVAPGLYWVRLTQGANRRTTRVAVIE